MLSRSARGTNVNAHHFASPYYQDRRRTVLISRERGCIDQFELDAASYGASAARYGVGVRSHLQSL